MSGGADLAQGQCVFYIRGGTGDGWGGCYSGGVPLGAVPAISWCGEVSLGG